MILRNGQPYSLGTPFTNDEGTQFPGNWYSLALPEERTNQGFIEVPDPVVPDERFYYINTDGTITEKPLDQCKAVILGQLANVRWFKENQGIIYNTANAMFQTDSASRVNYLGVLEIAKANSQYSTVWKARTVGNESQPKFVTINANDIITIYYSGMDYISKCFNNEEKKNQNIYSANSLSELLTIDLDSDWPDNNY